MNSKNHTDNFEEYKSLRTYFSQEITKNSNDLKSEINQMKSEMNNMNSDISNKM
jgi:hypothetical protein